MRFTRLLSGIYSFVQNLSNFCVFLTHAPWATKKAAVFAPLLYLLRYAFYIAVIFFSASCSAVAGKVFL